VTEVERIGDLSMINGLPTCAEPGNAAFFHSQMMIYQVLTLGVPLRGRLRRPGTNTIPIQT
jgi:hypothetical protein